MMLLLRFCGGESYLAGRIEMVLAAAGGGSKIIRCLPSTNETKELSDVWMCWLLLHDALTSMYNVAQKSDSAEQIP